MLIELTMKPKSCFDKYFQTFQEHCDALAASFLGRDLVAQVIVPFATLRQPRQRLLSWDAAVGRDGRWSWQHWGRWANEYSEQMRALAS